MLLYFHLEWSGSSNSVSVSAFSDPMIDFISSVGRSEANVEDQAPFS